MRDKGMVNTFAMQDFIARTEAAIAAATDLLMTFLPTIWPPFQVIEGGFYTEEDYQRNTPDGTDSGMSRHCVESVDAAHQWRVTYEAPADAWLSFRALGYPGLLTPFVSLTAEGIFDPFGRGHNHYERDHWKAGSVDREVFDTAIARAVEKIKSILDALNPLLVPSQLGKYTGLLTDRLWTWETFNGAFVDTLEIFAGRFIWDDVAREMVPHLHGNLPELIWDGFAAEMLARRKLAKDLIEGCDWLLRDGVERTFRNEMSDVVRIWHEGSQTRRRGP